MEGSCGVPISNWEIAKQVGIGSVLAVSVICSIVFLVFYCCMCSPFCTLPHLLNEPKTDACPSILGGDWCRAKQVELEKNWLELDDTDSESEDDEDEKDAKEPLTRSPKSKKTD